LNPILAQFTNSSQCRDRGDTLLWASLL